MANKDDNKPSAWSKRINRKLDVLDTSMDNLYQSTYVSRTDNKSDMDRIVGSIDDTIDRIINNGTSPKVSDISNLYTRIQKKQGISNQAIVNSAMELFADNTIVSTLSMSEDVTQYIQAEDYQYDLICQYMPSLNTALEIKRDNVLSSDNFSKDFLNVTSDTTSRTNFEIFNDKSRRCIEKYQFQDVCEELYERASKYGEAFLYVVPYDIALQRLLDRRSQYSNLGIVRAYSENGTAKTESNVVPIYESSNIDAELSRQLKDAKVVLDENQNCSVNLTFDDSAIFSEAIQESMTSKSVLKKSKDTSLSEAFTQLMESAKEAAVSEDADEKDPSVTWDSVYKDKKSSGTLDGGINDGLYVRNSKGKNNEKVEYSSGCVVDFIERGDILPVYMDNLCVGYYHFTCNNQDLNCCEHGKPNGTISGIGTNKGVNNDELTTDVLLGYVAQRLSDSIDAHFINANKDLKEEIYAILKYNDKFSILSGVNNITVAFLPVDDVFHFYLKLDRKTHRGVSSLKKSLVPAMLYCLLYLTTTIGQVTRAQDKRIYYVKQNVETNVARTMMNVINQIKRGNMGMRQIQSMNSILGIVGKYNDHIIPMGQSGDAPIQFETMQGQEINTPSDLMDRFENQAVEGTDVPYEFTQSVNQVDYATRFTMSNSKFLRKVYKEQRICQEAFSKIFTKLYNYEYGENERCIKVLLPAPAFLSMTNTQQLIDNTKNYINAICEVELATEQNEEVKQEFQRIMIRNHLGSYIDYGMVDEAITQARLNISMKPKEE